ncbi:MAG: GntR family transcriptional regulator [bacterium]|nr:GntR family transcriptional regulator [bacterium]
MSKILRKKLSNQVYERIKEMIANHRFKPGSRINVEKIAKELGVSRTPVWEAVSRLEQEDLVENVPNRGVFMTVLTPERALDLYAVREVLEGMAGRLAAAVIDEHSLKTMSACLVKQKKVIEKKDLVAYSKLDFEFHALIYEACKNPVLQEMLEAIKDKMRPISMHIQPMLSRLYEDHVKILRALENRNPEQAEDTFRNHNQLMIELIKEESEAGRWHEFKEGMG